MAEAWLAGAEAVGCTKSGGSYDGSPMRLVIHTVEGDPGTVDGCRALAESHTSPPQLWYHPRLRWLGQGIGLDRSAYALAHPSGTPETNKAGALQVEVFGFAADTPGWTVECDNLGADVLGSILAAGYPIDTSQIAPTTGNDGYGEDGAVRMDWDEWTRYPGVCCHSNVPGQDHWDAGAIDLHRIVRAATGTKPKPAPEETEMAAPATCIDDRGRTWFFYRGAADSQLWAVCVGHSDPFPLGGKVTDAISAQANSDGSIDVFAYAPEPKGDVWAIRSTGSPDGWNDGGGWYRLPGW